MGLTRMKVGQPGVLSENSSSRAMSRHTTTDTYNRTSIVIA